MSPLSERLRTEKQSDKTPQDVCHIRHHRSEAGQDGCHVHQHRCGTEGK